MDGEPKTSNRAASALWRRRNGKRPRGNAYLVPVRVNLSDYLGGFCDPALTLRAKTNDCPTLGKP